MSILVILTNDCGRTRCETVCTQLDIDLVCVEANCDRLTTDDRFFSNLFRLLVTIEQSSLTSEDKFDALALVESRLVLVARTSRSRR